MIKLHVIFKTLVTIYMKFVVKVKAELRLLSILTLSRKQKITETKQEILSRVNFMLEEVIFWKTRLIICFKNAIQCINF